MRNTFACNIANLTNKDFPETETEWAAYRTASDYERLLDEIKSAAANLQSKLAEVTRGVDEHLSAMREGVVPGHCPVNNLGELQSRGPDFDRLCTLAGERFDTVRMLARLVRMKEAD